MKKKTLTIIFAVVIICGGIAAAAVANLDRIMMAVSPELYISYRALNTANEIKKERSMIKDALPELRRLSDSHNAEFELNTDKTSLKLTEDYNSEVPSAVFNGTYNGFDFDGYINNTETGIAVPSLMDVYFTFSTQNFGNEVTGAALSGLLPVDGLSGLDLTLPSSNGSDSIISERELAGYAKTMIKDAKINHDGGNDYFMILKTENVKEGLNGIINTVKSGGALKSKLQFTEKIFGVTPDELLNNLSDIVNSAETGDTIAVGYTECKNYISRLETNIKNGDMNIKLSWKASNEVRLLEDYTLKVSADSDGSEVGIEYHESGNKFFKQEEKQDSREIKFIFGNKEIFKASINLNYDKSQLSGTVKINDISAQLSGTADEKSTLIKAENIMSGDNSVGSFSLNIRDFQNVSAQDRKKYPFSEIKAADLLSLMAGLIKGE